MVDGKEWIVSQEAADKITLQDHTVLVTGRVEGKDLIDKTVSHPLSGEVRLCPHHSSIRTWLPVL